MLEGQGISPVCYDALVGRVIILNETYQLKNQIIIHMTLSVIECWLLSVKPLQNIYIHGSVHHYNCSKINTNKMTLMDYPLFHG